MMANPNDTSLDMERRSNTDGLFDANNILIHALNLLIGIGGVIVEIFLIHILAEHYGTAWLWAYIPGTIIIICLLGVVDRYTK